MSPVLHADSIAATELMAAADGVVLVDFTAAWCPPCRALEPVLEQLAAENADLTVLSVDVDASPELAMAYEVRSMPTLVFLVDGHPVRRLVGARGIAAMREELHQARDSVRQES